MSKRNGVKPRTYTVEQWEDTFLSWSIADQENALRTLACLHRHAKKGRLGQPAVAAPEAVDFPLQLREAQ